MPGYSNLVRNGIKIIFRIFFIIKSRHRVSTAKKVIKVSAVTTISLTKSLITVASLSFVSSLSDLSYGSLVKESSESLTS